MFVTHRLRDAVEFPLQSLQVKRICDAGNLPQEQRRTLYMLVNDSDDEDDDDDDDDKLFVMQGITTVNLQPKYSKILICIY